MKHKVILTVIDKKQFTELQQEYCSKSQCIACRHYNVGDEFEFYQDEEWDDYGNMGMNTLVKSDADPDKVAGGPKMPHCSEAWGALSRYIYTGLKGGSIMKGFMDSDNVVIVSCPNGIRPVIFKVERVDYED